MNLENHVKVLAILHIAHSALVALLGFFFFFFLIFIGAVAEDEEALLVLSIVAAVLIVFAILFAVPGIIAGIGLLMKKKWGRILTLIVGFLKFIDFPLGTALAVYTIVILFREDAVAYFEKSETG